VTYFCVGFDVIVKGLHFWQQRSHAPNFAPSITSYPKKPKPHPPHLTPGNMENNARLLTLQENALPVIERRIKDLLDTNHAVPVLLDWPSLSQAREKEIRALLLYLERVLDNLEWLGYDEVSRKLLTNRLTAIRLRHVGNSLENSVNLINGNLITIANFSEPEELPSAIEIRRILSKGLSFPVDG
jgi:hypothetical protein